jgi:hypothetical protein
MAVDRLYALAQNVMSVRISRAHARPELALEMENLVHVAERLLPR